MNETLRQKTMIGYIVFFFFEGQYHNRVFYGTVMGTYVTNIRDDVEPDGCQNIRRRRKKKRDHLVVAEG